MTQQAYRRLAIRQKLANSSCLLWMVSIIGLGFASSAKAQLPAGKYTISAAKVGISNGQSSKTGTLFLNPEDKILSLDRNDSIDTSNSTELANLGVAEFDIQPAPNNGDYYTISVDGERLHEDGNGDQWISTRWGATDDYTLFKLEYIEGEDAYRIQTKATDRFWNVDVDGNKYASTRNGATYEATLFRILPTRSQDVVVHGVAKKSAEAIERVFREFAPGGFDSSSADFSFDLTNMAKTVFPNEPASQFSDDQQVFRYNHGTFRNSYLLLSSPSTVLVAIQGTAGTDQVGSVNLRPSLTDPTAVAENTVNINEFVNGRKGKGRLLVEFTGLPMGCASHLLADDILTHAGFSLAAQALYDQLLSDLQNANASEKQVIISGHSQGGALAMYTTYLLMRRETGVFNANRGPHYTIAIGGPDCSGMWNGQERFKDSFDRLASSVGVRPYNVLVEGDPIPYAWRNGLKPASPRIWAVEGAALGGQRWEMQNDHTMKVTSGHDGDLHWSWNTLPGGVVVERVGETISLPCWDASSDPHHIDSYILSLDRMVPPSLERQTSVDVEGTYVHNPKENDWHEGSIRRTTNGYEWENKAGVNWSLTASDNAIILRTGEDNPYKDSGEPNFNLVIEDGVAIAFVFNGDRFDRVGLPQRVSNADLKAANIRGARSLAESGDRIGVSVSGDRREGRVRILLTTAANITWWKAIKVFKDGVELDEIHNQDDRHSDSFELSVDPDSEYHIEFWKAKSFGAHTKIKRHSIDFWELQGNSLTFNWTRD